jgi:hypothetical protein
MGLLAKCAALTLALLAGCYEPQLVDCTIRCSGAADCASGQVCGADHFCAAPDIADHCSSVTAVIDAGVIVDGAGAKPDARPDAPPPPDAPTHGQLHVTIEGGKGRVTVDGVGTCTSDCTYSVPLHMPLTAHAVGEDDWHFEKWTDGPCIGQLENCAFTPTLVVAVTAKFKKD